MVEWILGQNDIVQAAMIVAFIDLLFLVCVAIKSSQENKKKITDEEFVKSEILVGKMR